MLEPAIWIAAAIILYNALCLVLCGYAGRLSENGRRSQAGKLLRALLWMPGFDAIKILIRYRLGNVYFQEQQQEQAEAQFRALLERPLKGGIAADISRRLADVLEAQGRSEEAAQVMDCAAAFARRGDNVSSLVAQGTLLKRSHRYADAIGVYEKALTMGRRLPPAVQGEIMVKAGLAAFDAGQPNQTIHWMEQAIALRPQVTFLRSAHNMAGVAYGNQGNFSKSIPHLQQAAFLARQHGLKTEAGRAMAMIVSHLKSQGNISQALAMCAEIEREGLLSRTYFITKAECLEALGRYPEAYQATSQARGFLEEGHANIPHYRRRQEGVVSLGLARALLLLDKPDEAWDQLQDAVVAFRGDGKLSLWCDATAAWTLAMLGRTEQAQAKMRMIETEMERFPEDRSGRLGCLSSLARTEYALGCWEQSAVRWSAYLNAQPNPVWQPRGWYFLGEALRQLGDAAGAEAAYRQANHIPREAPPPPSYDWPPPPTPVPVSSAMDFVETYEAGLARQRIAQMSHVTGEVFQVQ